MRALTAREECRGCRERVKEACIEPNPCQLAGRSRDTSHVIGVRTAKRQRNTRCEIFKAIGKPPYAGAFGPNQLARKSRNQ